MRVGVVFPQTEIGPDPIGVRDYVQAVEGLGFAHLLAYDHVLGAEPTGRSIPASAFVYTDKTLFHEVLVLFGYLAGLTRRLELVSGVIILPQRQTALVAKQAAEIDVLSGGRLRFGVGIGWNPVEYQGLNENFHDRGRRIEEQVELLRKLWTEPIVDFHGRWTTVERAGLNPMPIQRPIPVWFGGSADAALRRIARIADGWMPNRKPPEGWTAVMEQFRGYLRDAGRDETRFGIEARVNAGVGTPEQWRVDAGEWRLLGATHLDVNTMGGGLNGPAEHVERLRHVAEALEVQGGA